MLDAAHSDTTPKITLANASEMLGISKQALHRHMKASGVSYPRIGNKAYLTHTISKQLLNLLFTPKVIATQIVKGGVGKTTSVHNIGCCANAYGARVLLIDIDPQGNLTDAFGFDADEHPVLIDLLEGDACIEDSIVPIYPGLDLLPSRIENVIVDSTIINKRLALDKIFNSLLDTVRNHYDFLFIDCPPNIGHAVTAASIYADLILAPLNPEKFSAKGLKILKQEINLLSKHHGKHVNLKVFLNKFSANTILSDKAIATLIADPDMDGRTLDTAVRISQEIPNQTDSNRNLFSTVKKSSARDDFDQLTRELLGINKSAQQDWKSSRAVKTAMEA